MSKKRILVRCFFVLFAILSNLFVWNYIKKADASKQDVNVIMFAESDTLDEYQVLYGNGDEFDDEAVSKAGISKIDTLQTLQFKIKADADSFRFKPGIWPAHIKIYQMYFEAGGKCYDIPVSNLVANAGSEGISRCEYDEKATNIIEESKLATNAMGVAYIDTPGGDCYIDFDYDTQNIISDIQKNIDNKHVIVKILLCLVIDITIIILMLNIDTVAALSKNVLADKKLIFNLAKSDFKAKFAGSYFGIVWAFIQPIITVIVYWFALEIGLRSGKMCDYPFVLWLIAGLVPWFYFSEALSSGTNALTEYSYLVKKVVFKIEILPIVKVLSAIFVHCFFVAFVVVFSCFYKYYPDLYTLQLIYYILCMFALVLSITYITSATVIFFKDLTQIINIILQVGVWATPIMWDVSILSPKLALIMKINPVYYIVNGFRDSLLEKVWFWDRPEWTICFWAMVIILYVVGRNVFKRLQVHFADVL